MKLIAGWGCLIAAIFWIIGCDTGSGWIMWGGYFIWVPSHILLNELNREARVIISVLYRDDEGYYREDIRDQIRQNGMGVIPKKDGSTIIQIAHIRD